MFSFDTISKGNDWQLHVISEVDLPGYQQEALHHSDTFDFYVEGRDVFMVLLESSLPEPMTTGIIIVLKMN